jgi:hypothetical protein
MIFVGLFIFLAVNAESNNTFRTPNMYCSTSELCYSRPRSEMIALFFFISNPKITLALR